jgi:Di-haem oxidoreductase, putative peroxidase
MLKLLRSLALGIMVASGLSVAASAQQAASASPGLTADDLEKFRDGQVDFEEEETAEDGLGPVFNDTSCAACHIEGAPTRISMHSVGNTPGDAADRGVPPACGLGGTAPGMPGSSARG